MTVKNEIIETYGELASKLDCSVRHAKRLWRKHGFKLKHRLGPGSRIKMTLGELEKFRERLQGCEKT